MKINLNVFPHHYRCEPRDYKAILFMIVSFILAAVVISALFLGKNFQYTRQKSKKLEPVNMLRTEKTRLEREVQRLETKKKKTDFDINKKLDLNNRIREFNKIKRDFYWARFFQKLEEATPERIWVKNFFIETADMEKAREDDEIENVKSRQGGSLSNEEEQNVRERVMRKVYMACESSDMFKPIEYVKNLEVSEYFDEILLGRAEEDPESQAVKFSMEFEVNERLLKK
ncbi:MAG: hypothetical protein ACOCWO_03145 [Candidatus Muiribacteriaceae bacterium]